MGSALLVIDLQAEFTRRSAAGIPRSNPGAEAVIAGLVARARAQGLPVLHVHHDDPSPKSRFRIGTPGGEPMACAAPVGAEPVFIKRGSSGFVGTGLEQALRAAGIARLIIIGAAVNYCVASTVRMAADLGFEVVLVRDAVFGFGITGPEGRMHDPDLVLSVTLGTMAEFASVMTAEEAVAEF